LRSLGTPKGTRNQQLLLSIELTGFEKESTFTKRVVHGEDELYGQNCPEISAQLLNAGPLSAMSRSEIEQVLRNWIDLAISPSGTFPDGTDRAAWVADNFISWWRNQVDDSLSSADLAAHRLREELKRLRSAAEFDEALHELTHVQDALGDLRRDLGLPSDAANGG
jgi:hypothetical protein